MSKITVSVPVDQRAALLAGRVLGPTCEIAIDRDTMAPEVWARICNALEFPAGELPRLREWRVCDATQESLVSVVRADLDERAARDANRTENARARYVGSLVDFEADGIARWGTAECGYQWERWTPAIPGIYGDAAGNLPPDWDHRIAARTAEVERICREHNASHLAEVERIGEAAEADRQSAAAALASARITTGYWERETGAYNEKRHGAPWCARVAFPAGPKPVYEFGDSTAKWGKAGLLRLACRPGDIIAWGQKDLRNPGRGEHRIAVMEADGSMREVDKTEAFRLSTKEGGGK